MVRALRWIACQARRSIDTRDQPDHLLRGFCPLRFDRRSRRGGITESLSPRRPSVGSGVLGWKVFPPISAYRRSEAVPTPGFLHWCARCGAWVQASDTRCRAVSNVLPDGGGRSSGGTVEDKFDGIDPGIDRKTASGASSYIRYADG